MPQRELLDSLIHTTRHGAGFILRRLGRVVPGGVYFVNEADPLVDFYFPKEDHPKAADEELFAMVEAELRKWAARAETCGVALVTEIARDGRRVMAMQAETRTGAPTRRDAPTHPEAPTRPEALTREVVLLHYPLRRKLWWWNLGEAEEVEELLVPRFFSSSDKHESE